MIFMFDYLCSLRSFASLFEFIFDWNNSIGIILALEVNVVIFFNLQVFKRIQRMNNFVLSFKVLDSLFIGSSKRYDTHTVLIEAHEVFAC